MAQRPRVQASRQGYRPTDMYQPANPVLPPVDMSNPQLLQGDVVMQDDANTDRTGNAQRPPFYEDPELRYAYEQYLANVGRREGMPSIANYSQSQVNAMMQASQEQRAALINHFLHGAPMPPHLFSPQPAQGSVDTGQGNVVSRTLRSVFGGQ